MCVGDFYLTVLSQQMVFFPVGKTKHGMQNLSVFIAERRQGFMCENDFIDKYIIVLESNM